MSILSQPYFWDEQAAHAKLEAIVWPQGPVCTRCGATDRIGAVTGKGARAGLKFCCRCRKQFRATIGTMFEGSHVPLHKWFQACYLLSAAGQAISPHRLHLRLGVTNKTALGILHRLAAVINAAESRSLDGVLGLASRAPSVGESQRPFRRRAGSAPSVIGLDELALRQFPTQPRRQFLRFVEAVRELGCIEDEADFDRLLAKMGAHPVARTRVRPDSATRAQLRLGFPGPARRDLEQATA